MSMNLIPPVIFFILIFISTFFLVPLNIKLSYKLKLLDYPSEKSIHKETRPLCGGFSVALPILVALLVVHYTIAQDTTFPNLLMLLIGSTGILIAGFFDDKYRLSARWKLLFQLILAIFMYWAGFRITLLTNPWNDAIALGIFSFPLTLIWFLLLINSFNLIDGIDGLATGIGVIVTAVLVIIGFRHHNPSLIYLSIFLLAANSAFLFYNFPPAKIFLGDTGSQFLGFYIAASTISSTSQYKGFTAMTLLIPILILFIPLTDTSLAILRRIKYRKGIFNRDFHHLHHKMLKLGFTEKTINYICYFITFLFGLIAIGFSFADKNILFTILICLAVVVFIILYLIAKKELLK